MPPLIETSAIADTFAVGAEVDDSAEYVTLTFWAEHRVSAEETERVVVTRIVMPVKAYHRMVRELVGTPTMLS